MNIQERIYSLLVQHDANARKLYPVYNSKPFPKLVFFTKGHSAGIAKYNEWAIYINTYVGEQNCGDALIETITHEIAHLVTFVEYGERGHGLMWKRVHRSLCGNAERLYTTPVKIKAARRSNWYKYENACCNVWVGPKYHNALQSGKLAAIRHIETNTKLYASDYTGESKQKE